MTKVRIIVAGGRDFYDHSLLSSNLDRIISEDFASDEIIIVSGVAPGADREGETYAKRKGYSIHQFPAKWVIHGSAAGPIRNEEMAKNADVLVAFWNDLSPGTKNMIEVAKKYGLKTYIVRYNQEED